MAFSTTSPTVFLVTKSTDLSQLREVMVPTGNITLLVWKFLPKAESIPWEIDDLFVVDELTASSMPPQNSTRSIRSVASGDLGADDAVVGIRWDIFLGSYLTPCDKTKNGMRFFRDDIFGMGISRDKGTKKLFLPMEVEYWMSPLKTSFLLGKFSTFFCLDCGIYSRGFQSQMQVERLGCFISSRW